ncbi:MAG: toll/interleukin-1 receptor domain-containing protein [Euzebya sp.]
MAKSFDQARREMQQALRRAQQEQDRINRENRRRVNDYNRKAQQRNNRIVDGVNRHNRDVDRYNRQVAAAVDDQNRRADAHDSAILKAARAPSIRTVRYTASEQPLADRVQRAVAELADARATDVFLSYARIDGADVADELRGCLEAIDVVVWFDAAEIVPGKSQALQMDRGLAKAKAGVAVLTPAYVAGRFWTDRELGSLLHKDTLIPVLHGVTFDDVKRMSGILHDLAGFETSRDSVQVIADKIAHAVKPEAE